MKNKNQTFNPPQNIVPVYCPIQACKCTHGELGKVIGQVELKPRDGPPRRVAFPCKYKKVAMIWIDLE